MLSLSLRDSLLVLRWACLPIRANRFGAEGVLLLPGRRAFPLRTIPEVRLLLLVCVSLWQRGCVLIYLCLGDIIRMGGCFESTTGEVHFATTPSLSLWHHFLLRPLMQCASKGFLCSLEVQGGVWLAFAGRLQRIGLVSGCEGRPWCGCVGGWKDEEWGMETKDEQLLSSWGS